MPFPMNQMVRAALVAIAEYPITDERRNMDAVNMRQLALNILEKADGAQQYGLREPQNSER